MADVRVTSLNLKETRPVVLDIDRVSLLLEWSIHIIHVRSWELCMLMMRKAGSSDCTCCLDIPEVLCYACLCCPHGKKPTPEGYDNMAMANTFSLF